MSWSRITPERRVELAAKRLEERKKFNKWADLLEWSVAPGIDAEDNGEEINQRNREERFIVEVAAELLRQSKLTQIKRAITAARKKQTKEKQ